MMNVLCCRVISRIQNLSDMVSFEFCICIDTAFWVYRVRNMFGVPLYVDHINGVSVKFA